MKKKKIAFAVAISVVLVAVLAVVFAKKDAPKTENASRRDGAAVSGGGYLGHRAQFAPETGAAEGFLRLGFRLSSGGMGAEVLCPARAADVEGTARGALHRPGGCAGAQENHLCLKEFRA